MNLNAQRERKRGAHSGKPGSKGSLANIDAIRENSIGHGPRKIWFPGNFIWKTFFS